MYATRQFLALSLLMLVLSGCDVLHRDQLLVRPATVPDTEMHIEQENLAVAKALAEVARRYGFADSLQYSRMDGVVAYYMEESEDFPIAFGARRVGTELIVDLRHFKPGSREEPRYIEIRDSLVQELAARLGANAVSVLERTQHVP